MFKRFERLAAYLPLVGTAVILIVQNFFQSFLTSFGSNLALATIAASFVLVAWHLEGRTGYLTQSVRNLSDQVVRLTEDQPRILATATSNFQFMPLGDGFKLAVDTVGRVDHLRVFAASGSQMHTFIQHNKLRVRRCSLLVQRPSDTTSDYSQTVNIVIDRWKLLVRLGRIDELEVLRYDFQPTEYQCIFDAKFLIHGLFDPNALEDSGLSVRDPIIVVGESLHGSTLIMNYIERYDRLFEFCRHGYGPNDPAISFTAATLAPTGGLP
jgi:hypothetical protein